MPRFASLPVAAFAFAALASASCSSAPRDVPAKTEPLEGFAVKLDVRASNYGAGELTFDALAKNEADRSLIGLTVSLSLLRADGSELQRVDVVPVSSRATIPVLEPAFSVPLHVQQKVLERPASIVARITKAELFSQPADKPLALDARGSKGADVSGLEFVSFGHFRIDSLDGAGPSPFHATLGIRNKGTTPIGRLEYGIAFTDEKGRDVDRIPLVHVFVPPLAPGDAVEEQVTGQARAYDRMLIDVRSVAKPE